ncbi:ATP-binding protein [Streptomyces sp. BE20]|uniref:ATP-binding protein n=1 Tax=Streptomyces sp. BE20 TaxID=3002525 RepID=UPI002E7984DE|nr:ATP-binding protein [Streptomyces sp. BE20]MEE1820797.1 ATP-binding protein [Streptomyces sp. BE20]
MGPEHAEQVLAIYPPLPEDGASALFQVINQRYLKSSTILSTNVGIVDWASAFGDATVAAAMLDRLLHRATVARAGSSTMTDSRTQSTSRRSYSANRSGKFASMQVARPKRTPSTSKTVGAGRPGV